MKKFSPAQVLESKYGLEMALVALYNEGNAKKAGYWHDALVDRLVKDWNTRNIFSLNGMVDSLAEIRRATQLKKHLDKQPEFILNNFAAKMAQVRLPFLLNSMFRNWLTEGKGLLNCPI